MGKMRKVQNKNLRKERGITLVALAVTIILLLILASISITGAINGGLFEHAENAKNSVEISNEKEIVQEAIILAEGKSKNGTVTEVDVQKEIPTQVNATVIDNGDTLVVKFNKKDRYYEIENSGNVEGPKELVKDEHAGDITKGGACDGSSNKPFKITCIEDLVAFSIMSNGGNKELGLTSSRFTDQYVELTRTLDFKSIFSYKDYTTKIYGDLNTDGTVEDIRTELIKTNEGCIGFPPITSFSGTFNGNGNSIDNIYQYASSARALVINSLSGKIENLNISGNITSTGGNASGFGYVNIISNCKNYANITGFNRVGGISTGECTLIIDCENYGTIHKTGSSWQYSAVGGIAGISNVVTIKNCTNYGKIISDNRNCAGILGSINEMKEGETQIINCINKGEAVSGIFSYTHYGEVNILNCYNLGKTTTAGIADRGGDISINNCYNAGITNKAIIGSISDSDKIVNAYYDQTKCTSAGVVAEGVVALNEEDIKNNETFIQTLNSNIGANTEWKRWKIGEDGWPTFE